MAYTAVLALISCVLAASRASAAPPPRAQEVGRGGYPRGLQLRGSGGGSLVCAGMRVYSRPTPVDTATAATGFSYRGTVLADPRPGVDLGNCQLAQLPGTGRLLAAYRHHVPRADGATAYSLQVSASDDAGASWFHLSTVVESSVGMWEPFLFVDTRVQPTTTWCAYSQELSNGGNQSVVWRRSPDGGVTWRPPRNVSYGPAHRSRDGMPGITRLADDSLLVVFEGFWAWDLANTTRPGAQRHFSVQMRRSLDDGETWSPGRVIFTPPAGSAGVNAGAPQVTADPNTGDIFVSFMTDEDVGTVPTGNWVRNAECKVMRGRLVAGGRDVAFDVAGRTLLGQQRPCLWPGLAHLDGRSYAMYGTAGGTSYLTGPLENMSSSATAAPSPPPPPPPPPNFVIFLADDLGFGDWSRTGSPARTPHLDAMSRAPHTVWFQRTYSGNPICSPTRASLQTGRTPARSCIWQVEQHILCHGEGVGGCNGKAPAEFALGNATRNADRSYLSGLYGKWHLGSLRDRGVGSPDCYRKPENTSCQLGYTERNGGCCFGLDGTLDVSHPLNFGYDEFVATPACAASATTNCGCFFYPHAHNDTPCDLGHYQQDAAAPPYNECRQYYVGNATTTTTTTTTPTIEPIHFVSGVDDEQWLVDHVASLVARAVAQQRPFLAVVAFHGVHIPYVATPAMRATYPGLSLNEQDYYGTITQIDAQVGRVRRLLREHGVENRTWVSIMSDNGPEVSPAGGQGTGSFVNPGSTAGHRGRKRDVTEGGTRVIGLVEYPAAVPATPGGRVEAGFPISTMDILPTVLDALQVDNGGRALDGMSLLPALRGEMPVRPREHGIGVHGIFRFGSTNHRVDPATGRVSFPDICPEHADSEDFGDVPAGFSTPGNNAQFSWAEGNELKIFGCRGHCDGTNCNSTRPGYRNLGWRFFLFNLTADAAERHDLWRARRDVAAGMFARFEAWQGSVRASMGPEENGCAR